jgi:hypothetical protein
MLPPKTRPKQARDPAERPEMVGLSSRSIDSVGPASHDADDHSRQRGLPIDAPLAADADCRERIRGVEVVDDDRGVWAQLGAFTDFHLRPGAHLAVGYSLIGVEGQLRELETGGRTTELFGILRLPIGLGLFDARSHTETAR